MRTHLTKKYILKKFEISCPLRYLQDPDGVILRFLHANDGVFTPQRPSYPVMRIRIRSDPDLFGRIRIRTSGTGSGSWP
jgi:hypothetical protein